MFDQLTSFQKDALTSLDYSRILKCPPSDDSSEMQHYIFIRALIIVGHYHEAELVLGKTPPSFHSSKLGAFLRLQIKLFKREDLPALRCELIDLASGFPSDSYYLAEYHLILGILHSWQDRLAEALRYNTLAADHYRSASLPGHRGQALYNLCLNANHLNMRPIFNRSSQELKEVAESTAIPAVRLQWLRIFSYILLDQEEIAKAVSPLREALSLCETLSRKRDWESVACDLAYVLIKNEDLGAFTELHTRFFSKNADPENSYAITMIEYDKLAKAGLMSSSQSDRFWRHWKHQPPSPAQVLYLTDLLLERLLRAQDYHTLWNNYRRVCRLTTSKQNALSLWDVRFYGIIALIKLGKASQAMPLLTCYKSDAKETSAPARIDKALLLESMLNGEISPSGSLSPDQRIKISLDLRSHQITVGARVTPLISYPVIEHFLKLLFEAKRPLSFEQISKEIYGLSYQESRLETRINSLIYRTRGLMDAYLGEDSVIERRGKKIYLHARVIPELIEDIKVDPRMNRRENILRYLERRTKTVSIGELEERFSCTRRTLQFDLTALLKSGKINRIGNSRSIHYELIKQESEICEN